MRFRRFVLAAMALISIPLISCSGKDNDDPEPSKLVLNLRASSVEDGASVDPSTTSVTLTYTNLIQTVSDKDITLNGKKVQATAKGMVLEVAVDLDHWKDYELKIPEGAVTVKDNPKVSAAGITIKFNTRVGSEPEPPGQLAQQPVNASATQQARELYANLLSGYGRQMLSGAMGGIGWETTYTDFIHAQAGAYPCVVGFDYLHLPYSPSNWIDYGNITPVRDVHARGCIVQIQWHWNVPKSQGSSEFSFYKDGNSFNPANILVEGTWENEFAEKDVAKLAGYLTLLQDAGIPVLWRPFHEAAGDYKWGAWFWWGTKGVDVTRSLYRWLYDKLTNQYGLNNLLWVWTVQTSSEGKPASISQMQAAYPGDDCVDIVGADIYPDQPLTDQTATFRLVDRTVGSRKMVALTECGNLVDPGKALSNDALWCYFMQWYDYKDGKFGFFNYSGPEQWTSVIAHPFVITR